MQIWTRLPSRCAETGREQVWVVEPVEAGQEITISYIRQGAADGEAWGRGLGIRNSRGRGFIAAPLGQKM